MALFNYATRELSAKIVYYGPGLSGKTTNIEMVHQLLRPEQKGRLISLPTETDRTLFFDFLPLDLGQIKGFRVRFHLYTVPGQVFYNATRRLVLQGVDGVVFVADSQVGMEASNEESLKNLSDNLATYGKKLDQLPFVLQYNKRDLRNILPVGQINAQLNTMNVPTFEAVAKDGKGVTETLVAISRLVFAHLRKSLLMPGDAAAHEEIGELADLKMKESLAGQARKAGITEQEAAGLEEISEVEEVAEPQAPAIVPGPPAGKAAERPAPDDTVPMTSGYEPPEGVEMIPMAPEPPPAVEEAAPPPAPPAPAAPPRTFAELEAIEVEPPAAAPPSPAAPTPAAPTPRIELSVEADRGLTFMRFENVHVSPEGHAVLPALFLDADGNPVRIRLRVSFDEGRS